jgi:multiple sugar transport system substrate-binding protein
MERLSRRSFLASTMATLGGIALTSCGGTSASNGPVTLRWSMWVSTPQERAAWAALADNVKKAYPNITVNLETSAFNPYWDKLQTELASNTQADIIGMQGLRMPAFAARQALQPLQSFIDKDHNANIDDFYQPMRNMMSFKNQLYGLPYDIGPIVLYYNSDLFKAKGVAVPSATTPMTWDEFRDTALKLTNAKKHQYGFVIGAGFDSIVPWLWSGGADYMNDAETTSTLDTPEALAALHFVMGLLLKDKCAVPITDLSNSLFAAEQFYSGNVGMTMGGPYDTINMRANAKFKWDIIPLPAGTAGSITRLSGSGFGISPHTRYPEQAWQALKLITGTASLKQLASIGRAYPARSSATSAFLQPGAPLANIQLFQKILDGSIPNAQAHFFRTTTTWQETEVMFTQEFNPVFLGLHSVEQVVATVKPKFDTLLKEHQSLIQK